MPGFINAHPGYHPGLDTEPCCLMPAFAISSKHAFLLSVLLALAGCATSGGVGPAPVDDVNSARATQLTRDGDLDAATDAWLELAGRGGDRAAGYRLRAAETRRDAGDFAGVERITADIKRRRLVGDEALRLDLLEAELALRHGDAARASALLTIPETGVPAPLRARVLELRARSEAANGKRLAAARLRTMLDGELDGVDREDNREQLLDLLAGLDESTLKAHATTLRPDDPLLPAIEQAIRRHGGALPRTLPIPQRPVGTLLPGSEREGYRAIAQVALILPFGGQVAGVAQSIRDGFLAAYYNDVDGHRPSLRLYDAGRTPEDAIAAYRKAVADGAGVVVGPLQREAVGALLRQSLPVRVLALNHPDSGETPPPGSAEFGLLPDAEGMQAAERMLSLGLTRAAIIAADTDWAERAALAFRAQFESRGGTVTGEARIRESEVNYKSAVLQAAAAITDATQTIDGSVRRDTPTDAGVFISMRPQQARLLAPQLKLAGVNVPVLATSHIHSGETSPGLDRDLDGIEFCDAAWLFGTVPGRPDRNEISHYLRSAGGVGARLFAFGMDAYALLPYLDWLLANRDAYLDGATGQLAADSFGRIHRVLTWARYSGGVARPVYGALSPAAP